MREGRTGSVVTNAKTNTSSSYSLTYLHVPEAYSTRYHTHAIILQCTTYNPMRRKQRSVTLYRSLLGITTFHYITRNENRCQAGLYER